MTDEFAGDLTFWLAAQENCLNIAAFHGQLGGEALRRAAQYGERYNTLANLQRWIKAGGVA